MGMDLRRRSLETPYSIWRSEVDKFLGLVEGSDTAPSRADIGALRKAIRDMDLAMRDYMWSVRRVRAGDLIQGGRDEGERGFVSPRQS